LKLVEFASIIGKAQRAHPHLSEAPLSRTWPFGLFPQLAYTASRCCHRPALPSSPVGRWSFGCGTASPVCLAECQWWSLVGSHPPISACHHHHHPPCTNATGYTRVFVCPPARAHSGFSRRPRPRASLQ